MTVYAGKRIDPYRGFRFKVLISGFDSGGFSNVTGYRDETEVVEYREGIDGAQMRKLPGMTSYDNIILERGVSLNDDMQSWRLQVAEARGVGVPEDQIRRDVTIILLDRAGAAVKEWDIFDAWPAVFELDDRAADTSDVLIERMELANEGHVQTSLATA